MWRAILDAISHIEQAPNLYGEASLLVHFTDKALLD